VTDKAEATPGSSFPRLLGRHLAKQIRCECGYVARGESEDEVVQRIREHLRSDHPDLLERVSDENLRGWIEEA
jgi:predicted small metal-binding protein